MSLSMSGHIDNTFYSELSLTYHAVERTETNGIFTNTVTSVMSFRATVQPLSPRELNLLGIGLERIQDYRKIYINSGNMELLNRLNGYFTLNGEKFKAIQVDYRPARKYCKLILCRWDVQNG